MPVCMHTPDVTCVYCDLGARTGFVRVSPGPVVPQVLTTTNVSPEDLKKQYDEMNAAAARKELRERREKIAIAAMQGLLTSETTDDRYVEGELVKQAVTLADALIAELDRAAE